MLSVLGRCRHIDQVGDARDVEVLVQFVLLGRRADCDPQTGIPHASQQVRDRRERADERQVLGLEPVAPPLLQFLAVVPLLVARTRIQE